MTSAGAVLSLFALGGLAGLGGWFAHRRAARASRIAALIRDTPTSKVGDLRPGLVEVQGRVRPADTSRFLLSPLSGRNCVYFEFVVEEGQQTTTGTGRKRRSCTVWVNRVRDTQRRALLLDDGTGAVWVDLERAELDLQVDAKGDSGFLDDPGPAFQAALARYRVASAGWVFNKSLRYRETVLCEDDALYVLGTFDGEKITRGPEDVLVVTDRGEGAARGIREGDAGLTARSGYCLFALAGALVLLGALAAMAQRM